MNWAMSEKFFSGIVFLHPDNYFVRIYYQKGGDIDEQ